LDVLVKALVVACAALSASAGALYGSLPGVGDAPARVAAELRAHGARAGGDPSGTRVAAAVVAVEDERYFHHGAVDWRAIARAGVESVLHPGRDPGGSTLAQQLAKNLYLGGRTGPLDSLRAIGLAFKLEHRFSKRELLAMYLESVYFGHGHWGIDAAGRGYFGVAPTRLSWGEASLLAGLVQAPSLDDPVLHLARARARQRDVLARMVANHVLSSGEAAAAYRTTPVAH
jgi:penicillin-binding protein 1A